MADNRFVMDRLANGLIVAVEVMPHTRSTACGFLVRAGSRDDPGQLAGMSHFLEHMCFKGNERRTAEEINIGFDEIGADNNAQTSKDQTLYYSWARTEDLGRQVELLADVMRPGLPQDEFEIEKEVIIEEIASYKDDLSAVAYDFLYEQICPGHPISRPVLGYEATVGAMTRDDMQAYFNRRYSPDNMILVVAGNMDPDEVVSLARKHCGQWDNLDRIGDRRQTPTVISGRGSRSTDRFRQQAVAVAFPSVPTTHPLDETAEAVAAILGGANSRFFWNIYQKGLATRVSAIREEYEDFGIIVLVGLCEPENAERLLDAMRQEAGSLTQGGPEAKEIQRVKNHRRTFLATESEAPGYRLGQIADDVAYRGAPRPAEVRLAEVDAVSSETVAAYLKAFPIVGPGFVATVGPREWLPG
jgi:predicted Zn-dependent peptidase